MNLLRIVVSALLVIIAGLSLLPHESRNRHEYVISLDEGPLAIPLGKYDVPDEERVEWLSDNEKVIQVTQELTEVLITPKATGRARVCARHLVRGRLIEEHCRDYLVTSGRAQTI